MNIIPPSQNPVIVGHTAAIEQINGSYMSGRMHHAWLITGPEGIGKKTLAWHMAHFILSGGQNPIGKLNSQHPMARLVSAEAHPDLFVMRYSIDKKTGVQKDGISVEDARKLSPFLHMTATYGGWRVAIIEEAHALNTSGQNAILKVIEEPPEKCIIILTATTAGGLLPTIRSRCRVLPLQSLDDSAMRVVMARCDVDDVGEINMPQLIELSSGSAGFALRILETEALPLFDELLALLKDLPNLNTAKLHALADRIGRKADSDSFSVITKLLTDTLRRALRKQALGEPEDGGFPASLARGGRLDRTLQLWEKTVQTFSMADYANLDRKLAFVNAIMEIRKAVQ